MKYLSIVCLALMLAGCVSTNKSDYKYTTIDNLRKSARELPMVDGYAPVWRYAGSDKSYDYVYSYQATVIFARDFRYYKTDVGALKVNPLSSFHPAPKTDEYIFADEIREDRRAYNLSHQTEPPSPTPH